MDTVGLYLGTAALMRKTVYPRILTQNLIILNSLSAPQVCHRGDELLKLSLRKSLKRAWGKTLAFFKRLRSAEEIGKGPRSSRNVPAVK